MVPPLHRRGLAQHRAHLPLDQASAVGGRYTSVMSRPWAVNAQTTATDTQMTVPSRFERYGRPAGPAIQFRHFRRRQDHQHGTTSRCTTRPQRS